MPATSMANARDLDPSLNNYLANILGFSALLLQEIAPDDPRRVDLEEIHKAATAALGIVSAKGFSDTVAGARPPGPDEAPAPVNPTPEGLDAREREHIARVLGDVRGNKLAAAKRLGISRRTLYRRLERHGLS